MNYKYFFCLFFLIGSVLSLGCGPKGIERCSLHGIVTVDGQAVETGAITLIPESGTSSPTAGGFIENGKYTIAKAKGPAPGSYEVRLSGSRKTGKMIEVPGMNQKTEEQVSVIPKKYNIMNGGKEKLTATVVKGDNEINFELDSK